MKKYIGAKMIEAIEMNRGDYNRYRGWTIPEDENPADEGYLVEYSDGHESWSPKKQFEEEYKDCMGMDFGIALELMKEGYKVAREEWNGRVMFLYKVPYGAYIAMKTEYGHVVPWQANQVDMLSEDWFIVE